MTVITAYRVGDHHQPGARNALQQQFRIQYEDESIRPYIIGPHKQTMEDLVHFIKPLRAQGHDIRLFIDVIEVIHHIVPPQGHHLALKTDKGFHLNGTIDRSLRTFMENWFENILATIYGPDVPKTHIRGLKQNDFVLTTPGLRQHIKEVGMLDFEALCKSDHMGIFLDPDIQGVFGTSPERLVPPQFRKLKSNDARISESYRRALHGQF
jgi:hypothetical protein